VQLNIKTFKSGTVLFEEGSRGREVFLIQAGKVGVYRKGADGEVELAIIAENGIVGEMSLLDDLPRSATVRAIEDTKALIINESVFKKALGCAPVWLTSIIKIVVSRLRDANRRVDQSALVDRERGMLSLLQLLLPQYHYIFSNRMTLAYDLVLVEAYYVCRLRKKEIQTLLEGFDQRKLISIEEDTAHKKHVSINDLEALKLFDEYLVLRSEKKKFPELSLPEEAVGILSNIDYIAQKWGVPRKDDVLLWKATLLEDLSDKKPEVLERNLLDLRRAGVIDLEAREQDTMIVFEPKKISRIKKLKQWLPRFEEGRT
jgi:CRP-like cAMP-binding protein